MGQWRDLKLGMVRGLSRKAAWAYALTSTDQTLPNEVKDALNESPLGFPLANFAIDRGYVALSRGFVFHWPELYSTIRSLYVGQS